MALISLEERNRRACGCNPLFSCFLSFGWGQRGPIQGERMQGSTLIQMECFTIDAIRHRNSVLALDRSIGSSKTRQEYEDHDFC